ncbi:Tetratricopeptide repeat-like superfamily protein [Hibiscus syriacus]|uniref:Tetratricopeptide repeat-like superfamily protein n=1 Tax=Hibiscus syriacus TaxID=106335 RepID=A0A6A3CMA1_HIBSY|nr:uncharacterized protein LOC120163450 [Hibiscus syriacus]KAE8730530.1 Tetratricopeptide repeat-like superfamily protein [Hibiscus syriacus]
MDFFFFIATSSVLFGGFGVESDIKSDKTPRISKGGGQTESSEPKESILKANVTAEVDQREDHPLVVQDEKEEERSSELVAVEEDEDEELGLLSDEELNKKCEDFIRRMKEGIQFEARN